MIKKLLCTLLSLLFSLCLITPALAEGGEVVAHAGNIQFKESDVYSLKVNGVTVPVRTETITNAPFHVAMFSFDQNANIELTVKTAVSKHKLSPSAYNLAVKENGNTLSFTLDTPKPLQFEMQGEAPLILLATPLETDIPDKNDPNVIYFGPGITEAGIINLKSNQTVYLASGAVVIGRIQGVGIENARVCGRGILDTEKYTTKPYEGMNDPEITKGVLSGMNQTKGIFFQDSKNCKVEGIGTRNCREWQTLYLGCQNFEICNLNIMGTKVNNDGIDLDTVEDFYVHNNFIMCGDDGFGWHTFRANDTKEAPTRNIKADNNTIYNVTAGNGIRFGSSMESNLWENIEITNTYILKAKGNAVMVDLQDWATIRNLRIENVYVESAPSENVLAIQIVRGRYSNDVEKTSPYAKDDYRGHIENVTIKNLQAVQGTGVTVIGYDATHLVDNITLENIDISGTILTDASQMKTNEFVKNLTISAGKPAGVQEGFENGLADLFAPVSGNWFTAGGKLKQTGAGGKSLLTVGSSSLSDCTVSAEVTPLSSGQSVGVAARMADNKNYYLARLNTLTQKAELFKVQNDVLYSLGSAPFAAEIGKTYTLSLSAADSALTLSVNGEQLISAADSAYKSGKAGICGYTPNRNQKDAFEIDNFRIEVK